MATIKFYLDKRAVKFGEQAPLKIGLTRGGSTSYYSVGIKLYPHQWDAKRERIIDHPNRAFLNNIIANRRAEFENTLLSLAASGELSGLTAAQTKNRVVAVISPEAGNSNTFISNFRKYTSTRLAQSTREKYKLTEKRMLEYDKAVRTLSFEDITKEWLVGFENFLVSTNPSRNSRNIHLRNIRAVFNDAIDNGITSAYPFRKFKIKPEQTAKRSLTVSRLRELFGHEAEPWQRRYIDIFKLTFFLIGINTIDLYNLTEITNGRIVYKRAKTGRLYSIKVEPEALEIIERYKGRDYLLNFAEKTNRCHSFNGKLDKGLKSIGKTVMIPNPKWKRGSKKHKMISKHISEFPGISIYWARHTWATIAAELDIPNETIAAALGHGYGNKTTAIYIDYNMKKIDDANRRVIDYVLKGEK